MAVLSKKKKSSSSTNSHSSETLSSKVLYLFVKALELFLSVWWFCGDNIFRFKRALYLYELCVLKTKSWSYPFNLCYGSNLYMKKNIYLYIQAISGTEKNQKGWLPLFWQVTRNERSGKCTSSNQLKGSASFFVKSEAVYLEEKGQYPRCLSQWTTFALHYFALWFE